jgi:hypothetical protein
MHARIRYRTHTEHTRSAVPHVSELYAGVVKVVANCFPAHVCQCDLYRTRTGQGWSGLVGWNECYMVIGLV